jgi:hypothetical protein
VSARYNPQKPTPEDRDRRIVERWRERPAAKRRGDDVMAFYGWLSEHEPALIPQGPRSYQHVRTLVEPYVTD